MAVRALALRWKVYPCFIDDCDRLISKTAMIRVEGENSRLRHYLACLHRKTFCYSKSVEMLEASIRLLNYYLKHRTIPVLSRSSIYCATPIDQLNEGRKHNILKTQLI